MARSNEYFHTKLVIDIGVLYWLLVERKKIYARYVEVTRLINAEYNLLIILMTIL